MFSRALRPGVKGFYAQSFMNFWTPSKRFFRVMVAGGAGGIGQPLSLLLKINPLVTSLALYDLKPVITGIAMDLSHLDTPAKIIGYKAPQLAAAIQGSDVVVISAGLSRSPGMTRDDLFNANASIVRDMSLEIAKHSPKAIMAIITNPVNSLVPLACEVMKKAGKLDPRRILGVTTLDVVRAAAFIGEINGVDPRSVTVPVIGGHSGVTILPVLSQCQPALKLTDQAKIKALTERIQEAGTEVVKAKAGVASATLSTAYAGAELTNSILRGLKGESDVVECAYVKSDTTEAGYFSNPLLLGKDGVEKNLGIGELNQFEQKLLKSVIPELLKNIEAGENFAKK